MCLLNKFTACFVTAKFRSVRADKESVSRMREGEKVVRGGNGGSRRGSQGGDSYDTRDVRDVVMARR